MTQRSPWMRWTWGLSVTGVFAWSWLILWGLIPGTPAADEIAVDADVRFSIERESNGPLAGVFPGSVRKSDLANIGSLTLRESDDLRITAMCTNVRRLRIRPVNSTGNSRIAPRLGEIVPAPTLEAMTVSFTHLTTLIDLPSMPHLQDFSAVGCPVQSLDGLANLPNLRHLQVGISANSGWELGEKETGAYYHRARPFFSLDPLGARPLNIAELSELKQLESLSLRGRLLRDASPVLGLTKLRMLGLGYTRITSIEGIEQLPLLTRVELDGNSIEDLSPLLRLPALKEVALLGNPATEPNIATFLALEKCGVTILDRRDIRR